MAKNVKLTQGQLIKMINECIRKRLNEGFDDEEEFDDDNVEVNSNDDEWEHEDDEFNVDDSEFEENINNSIEDIDTNDFENVEIPQENNGNYEGNSFVESLIKFVQNCGCEIDFITFDSEGYVIITPSDETIPEITLPEEEIFNGEFTDEEGNELGDNELNEIQSSFMNAAYQLAEEISEVLSEEYPTELFKASNSRLQSQLNGMVGQISFE